MPSETNEAGEDERDQLTPDVDEVAQPPDIDTLVFKTCVVAIWSDGAMAAAERDHLSHLIDEIADSEEERNSLRRLALHDVNRHRVLTEVDQLGENERLHLFDRCVAVLSTDRKIRRQELRFLAELRRHSGVGRWHFQLLVWRLTRWRRLGLMAAGLGLIAVVAVLPWPSSEKAVTPPGELTEFREIALLRPSPESPPLDAEALYEQVRHSVVTVNVTVDGSHSGNGSGSVVGWDEHGQLYILTNRHVIYHELAEGQQLVFEAELESGVKLPLALDFYSRQYDLALLLVPGLSGWSEPLPILPRHELHVGQQVFALGSPMGLDHTFTSGVISALRGQFIQTDATVHMGSSGGPLFDDRGNLCGVVTTTHMHKDLSFAILADLVVDLLGERRQAKLGVDSVNSR